MRRLALGLVACSSLLAVPALAKNRVAVIVVGGDAAQAGQLQKTIEDALLTTRGVVLVNSEEVATKIGQPDPVPPEAQFPEQAAAEADKLLKQVEEIYFDADFAEASKLLGDVAKIYKEYDDALPTERRVQFFVWRAALYAGREELRKARSSVEQALVLRPALEVDTRTFSPSFVEMFNAMKEEIPTHNITLAHLPAGAKVVIDDRDGEQRMAVPAGKHDVVITALGFRRIAHSIDLKKGVVVRMPMSLKVEADAALVDAAWQAEPTPGQRLRADRLAETIGVDGVVIVGLRPKDADTEAQATLWWKGEPDRRTGEPATLDDESSGKIATWVSKAARSGPASGLSALGQGWQSRLDGGLFFAYRTRSLSAPAVAIDAAGGGPRLVFEIHRESFAAEAEVWYAAYQPSTIEVTLAGGDVKETNAGSRFYGRVSAGYRKLLGGDEGEPFVLNALLGASYEQHTIDDPRNELGPSGLLPSFNRITLDVRGRMDWQVARRIGLSAGLGVTPVGTWIEDPVDTLGTSPYAFGGLWSAGILWRPADRLHLGLDYTGELRIVNFTGRGVAFTQDAPLDTRWTETVHLLTFGVRRIF